MRVCATNNSFIKHPLFQNAFVYTASNILSRSIPFLLLPIFTRFLSQHDYGLLATFDIITALIIIIVSLNAQGAVGINFFKLDKLPLRRYVGTSLVLVSISFVFMLILTFVLRNSLSPLIKFPADWLPLTVFIGLTTFFYTLTLTLWQSEQRPLPYGIFQGGQTFLNILLSLYLVMILGWHWQGRAWGIVGSSTVFALLGLGVIYKRGYIDFTFDRRYACDILKFGLPLIPHSLAGWIMTATDRIFINRMIGLEATGLYVVGYQVGSIIELLVYSFNLTWAPFLYKKLQENQESTKSKIVQFTYLYFMFVLLLAVILTLLAPWLFKILVGSNFYPAHHYVLWIALGGAANGMYYMVVNYIFYMKKTHILTIVTIIAAATNVLLNYYLIKINGAIGAAQATAITSLLTFLAVWRISAKVCPMPWGLQRAQEGGVS